MIRKQPVCFECGAGEYCTNCYEYVFICDNCEEEVDELYKSGNDQLCEECFIQEAIENAEKVRL